MSLTITNKADIESLLPHANGMVLLDTILTWDESSIECSSANHHHANNPLRINGRLSSMAGIEYAAQAMAAHSLLLAQAAGSSSKVRKGFVAVASKIESHCTQLDDEKGELLIRVDTLDSTGDGTLVEFTVKSSNSTLLTGRLLAVLEKPKN